MIVIRTKTATGPRPMHGVKVVYDPIQAHTGVPHKGLEAACGLIPFFVQDVAYAGPEDAAEAFKLMVENYGFPVSDMLVEGEGTIESDGTHKFPGDPDQAPYVSYELEDTPTQIQIMVYQYGFVVVRDNDSTYMTRMD